MSEKDEFEAWWQRGEWKVSVKYRAWKYMCRMAFDAGRAQQAVPTLTDEGRARRCQQCNAPRKGDECHKCGAATVEPCAGWEEPALPPINRIRELAREIGYAVGVHGTQERDLDLIAAPWSEEAATLNYREVMQHIADGLGARLVEVEGKPLGRRACTIQMDGWYKPIDLSVCPMLSASPADQVRDLINTAFQAIFDAYNQPGDRFENDYAWCLNVRKKVGDAYTPLQQARAILAAPQPSGGMK